MDELMMQRCLQLALNGLGNTYPNPIVGSVIVHNNQIIGEGWHRKAGEPHAEINAIRSCQDKTLLKESTIYVNLEPCSHYGKTPPCAHQIVALGIPKVVIGTRDKASHVNGRGIQYLREHGVEVIENVLKEESEWINRRFFTYHTKQRPYIILKYAQTANGYFAPIDKEQKWITGNYAKQTVHKWRTEEASILIGKNTAEIDQPQLTARLWEGQQPLRVLISRLVTPAIEKFLDSPHQTLVFTESKIENTANVTFQQINFDEKVLPQILKELYQRQIQSIIVEGGATTLWHFIQDNLWDEARVFTGNLAWENGVEAPTLNNALLIEQKNIGEDNYQLYINSKI